MGSRRSRGSLSEHTRPDEPQGPVTSRRGPGRGRNIAIGVVLLVGLGVGLYLVLAGGSQDQPDESEPEPAATVAPLRIDDLTLDGINDAASLDIPADAGDFLTARLDNDTQLDVTFTLPEESAVARFVDGSGLPEPEAGRRLILHSSPLWQLNAGVEPEGPAVTGGDDPAHGTGDPAPGTDDPAVPEASAFRGTVNEIDGIRRAVEFVPEGDLIRVRIVLTAA